MIMVNNLSMNKNVLMNQTGGEEIRTGIVWNKNVILDIYSVNGGSVLICFTPTLKYIKEEFVNYGYSDLDNVFNIIHKSEYISEEIPEILDVIIDNPYHKVIELSNGYFVTVIYDNIFINKRNK